MKKATLDIQQDIARKLENEHTLSSVKKFLLKNLDQYGTARLSFPDKGFSLFYTSNDNFQRGVKNGGGAGMYARLQYSGATRDIKINI